MVLRLLAGSWSPLLLLGLWATPWPRGHLHLVEALRVAPREEAKGGLTLNGTAAFASLEGHSVVPPVFLLGWKKTGTTSFTQFFEELGLGPTRPGCCGMESLSKHGTAKEQWLQTLTKGYRSFQDAPWCCDEELLPMLDRLYPHSKYILTVRDSEKWFKSLYTWATVVKPDHYLKYTAMLGAPIVGSMPQPAIRAYEMHNQRVREIFRGSDRLLELNIVEGDAKTNAERACAFLSIDATKAPTCKRGFPHVNSQALKLRQKSETWLPSRLFLLQQGKVPLAAADESSAHLAFDGEDDEEEEAGTGEQQAGRGGTSIFSAKALRETMENVRLGLTAKERAHVDKLVSSVDADGNGHITHDELRTTFL